MSQKQVTNYLIRIGAFSTKILINGESVYSYGNTSDIFNIASIRKPLLGALFGCLFDKKKLDLSTPLSSLYIDDINPPLLSKEKQATIEDLLTMSSGIYHQANYETSSMQRDKPVKGSHIHGTYWFYNNWDPNAMGTIYRKITGNDIFLDFKTLIADPIGMPHFNVDNCEYKSTEGRSIHEAYIFRMSVDDLAKFGNLYLQNGIWNNKQILSSEWITKSIKGIRKTSQKYDFGYYWNVAREGMLYGDVKTPGAYAFSGFPGHFLFIYPAEKLVVVYEHNLESNYNTVTDEQFGELIKTILS